MVGKICDDLSEEVHFSWILRRKKNKVLSKVFSENSQLAMEFNLSCAHRGRG